MKLIYNISIVTMFIFGIVFSIYGIKFILRTSSFLNESISTIGFIVELKSQTRKNNTQVYAPKVKFTSENGKEHVFVSGYYYSKNDFELGQQIEVLYAKNDPSNSFLNDQKDIWGDSLGIFIGGMLCVFVGGYFSYQIFK